MANSKNYFIANTDCVFDDGTQAVIFDKWDWARIEYKDDHTFLRGFPNFEAAAAYADAANGELRSACCGEHYEIEHPFCPECKENV